jgi:hypothetical protein
MIHKLAVTDREFHTILAALRCWQASDDREPFRDIASNCDSVQPLTNREVDALVIRLNTTGIGEGKPETRGVSWVETTGFIQTVEATGGVTLTDRGYEPVADPDWLDLGDAYIAACKHLGRQPKLVAGEVAP